MIPKYQLKIFGTNDTQILHCIENEQFQKIRIKPYEKSFEARENTFKCKNRNLITSWKMGLPQYTAKNSILQRNMMQDLKETECS